MAVNTTTWESTLQTKLNDTTLTSKDMLLVGKTLEATTGNIAVSDVNTAGATQVAAVNSIATSTFKTVGGTSILGSGNIESLPAGGSTGQVVTNTGSGTGGWADAAAGGKVLQVVQGVKTDRSSFSGVWQTITGLSATITPSSTSSKILVGINVGSASPTSNTNSLVFRIMRDSTAIGVGDSVSSRIPLSFRTTRSITDSNHSDGGFQTQVLDSPNSTSAITYALKGNAEANTSFYINRSQGDSNDTEVYSGTTHSSIILMEIGA